MLSLQLPTPLIDLQIPLLYTTNIFALAISPSNRLLQLSTLPIFVLLVSQSLYREWSGTWGIHYAVECMVLSVVWQYIDWILLQSPDREEWGKIHHENGEKEKVPQRFWQRVWWGVRLASGNRYVGWSQEVKNVNKEVDGGYSRARFVARKATRAIMFYLLRDLSYAYTASTPYGSWVDIVHVKPIQSLSGRPFLTRFWCAWVYIFLTYFALEQANAAYGALSVAFGFANPRDCPSAFGDLRGLYTLRNAWSSVWHQQCRRICSAPGIFLARDVLHLRRGSFASKYFQLFVGFGISGVVHGCASMFVHGSFNDDGAFAFFLAQAAIIMVEDHVIELAKRLGLKSSTFWHLVGLLWTVFAIGVSSEPWASRVIDNSMWIHDRALDVFGIGPGMIV